MFPVFDPRIKIDKVSILAALRASSATITLQKNHAIGRDPVGAESVTVPVATVEGVRYCLLVEGSDDGVGRPPAVVYPVESLPMMQYDFEGNRLQQEQEFPAYRELERARR